MENTNENKAKFFAQYWGQDIFKDSMGFKLEGFDIFRRSWISGNVAELKPLSEIKDEDAIEVAKLYGAESAYCEREQFSITLYEDSKLFSIWFDGEILTEEIDQYPLFFLNGYDYLRSKGYALPWMGLSVKKQIEYGWIKLAE